MAVYSFLKALLPLAFAAAATSWPVQSSGFVPPGAECQDYMIPATVTSENFPWLAPKWTDDYGFIDFASEASSRTDDGFPSPIGNFTSETASYEIGATFCTPKTANKNTKIVLLATHGLGFDRSYWNPAYKPDQYNFVQYAITKGYSVFFYDRLGVGKSTKVSGYVNQLNIQTSILSSLITSLHQGKYSLLPTAPTAIALIGHSFGSWLTNSLVAAEPAAVDAAIMTGYGLKGSDSRLVLQGFSPRIANLQNPKFADFDSGYLTTGDVFGNINNFFKAPAYEHDVAAFSEANKQPFGVAELISLSTPLLKIDATAFKGPALVISGEFDYIVCGGFCPGELEPSFKPLFTGARDFETYVQPLSGHGANFAINATGFYEVIFEYLGRNGL